MINAVRGVARAVTCSLEAHRSNDNAVRGACWPWVHPARAATKNIKVRLLYYRFEIFNIL